MMKVYVVLLILAGCGSLSAILTRPGYCEDSLVRQTGPRCKAAIRVWTYDKDIDLCIPFIWGGCGVNGNNFDTFAECLRACGGCPLFRCPSYVNGNHRDLRGCTGCNPIDTCDLPSDPGHGGKFSTRYFHNQASRQCERFRYGGIGGNANNFLQRDDCFDACRPCPVPGCLPGPVCSLGFQNTADGCMTCTCVDPDYICSQPVDPGTCDDNVLRYYFNSASGRCEAFIYSGCFGNRNKFDSLADCEAMCASRCSDIRCALYCEFGFKVGKDGCEICECQDDPCEYGEALTDSSGLQINCRRGGQRCPAGSSCNIHPTDRWAVCCSDTDPCRAVLCELHCVLGFQLDDNGCEICKCKVAIFHAACSSGKGCVKSLTKSCWAQRWGYCDDCDDYPKDKCCCVTHVKTCDGDNCKCVNKSPKSCHERNMRYCNPNSRACVGCEPHQCCCKGDTISDLETLSPACPHGNGCVCSIERCFDRGIGYCDCPPNQKCPQENCCCEEAAPTCPGNVLCVCAISDCLNLNMVYCDPDVCGPLCAPSRCCCSKKDQEHPCDIGHPLTDTSGHQVYCGMGGQRCPKGYVCNIHPTDVWAVCCPETVNPCEYGVPLTNAAGYQLDCANPHHRRCPKGSSCTSHPAGAWAVCCPNALDTGVGTFHPFCQKGRFCVCAIDTCFQNQWGYCTGCGPFCPEEKCCCPTPVPTCSDIDSCVCATDGHCDTIGMQYCDPAKCGPDCAPYRCCCKHSEIGSTHPACIHGVGCVCARPSCHHHGFGYCHCPIDSGCPDYMCCCPVQVPQCNAKDRCHCSDVPCHGSRGKKYCDPSNCDERCAPDHCCCEESDGGLVGYNGMCLDGQGCFCGVRQCFELGVGYCKCPPNMGCERDFCCCNTKVDVCNSDDPCVCLTGKHTCDDNDMAYCDPDTCGPDCRPERCCCKKHGMVPLHDKCKHGHGCACNKQPCFTLGYALCQCPPEMGCEAANCCCELATIKKCKKHQECVCAVDGPCHKFGWKYCNPKECGPHCEPHKCCCSKKDEIIPLHESCTRPSDCVCQRRPCHVSHYGYCRCPPGQCGARNCCCPTKVRQCSEDDQCKCLATGVCHLKGMDYCDPHVCGPYCPPWRCCCKKSAPMIGYGCEDERCRCKKWTCHELGREYCKCKNCDEERCCCDTPVKTCTGEACECKQGKKSCFERGLKYCPPGKCGKGCPAAKCCCKETGVVVLNSYGCEAEDAAASTCHCYKTTCYQQQAEYCKCRNCDEPHCCCNTKVKTCLGGSGCECKRGKKSCHQRGLAYCPPGSCDKCPDAKCCCKYPTGGCYQLEKNQCMSRCLAQDQVAVPGTECIGCSCMDVCALTVCPPGSVCQPQSVTCVQAPCPPVPACVAAVCSLDETDKCMFSCLENDQVAVSGTECIGCRCVDVCARTLCRRGFTCEAQDVVCVRAPCPPRPICVADHVTCTGGRVFEACFNGCPHNPSCGDERYGCDPVLDLCEQRCICPPDKPYINSDDECVAVEDCKVCPGGAPNGPPCDNTDDCKPGYECTDAEYLPSVCCLTRTVVYG